MAVTPLDTGTKEDIELRDIGTPTQKQAVQKIREILLQEVSHIIGKEKIQERNPSITEEHIVDHYIAYLKRIADPRVKIIAEILEETVDKEIVDDELRHFEDLTRRFQRIVQVKETGGNAGHLFDNLDFGTVDELVSSANKYDEKEALVLLSQFQRPVLENILLAAVAVNVILMIGHNLDSTKEFTEILYQHIGVGNLSGKSVVSLGVILPFLYEAVLKIRTQGVMNYLKHNKLDALLNVAGIGEMGLMVEEAFGVINNHTALGSLLRSLRILRIFRVTQKNKVVKELTESLTQSAPIMMKIAFTFWGFSLLTTLFFMEVYAEHMKEFGDLSSSFDQMTRLFFNDNAIELNYAMRGAEGVHPFTNEIAIWWARTYQFISNIFMIGIPPGIIFEYLSRKTTTKRYLAAIWEKLQEISQLGQEILTTLQKMKGEQHEIQQEMKGKLEALRQLLQTSKTF